VSEKVWIMMIKGKNIEARRGGRGYWGQKGRGAKEEGYWGHVVVTSSS
jgi:hypothetical protein